jgi:hypothetical protein
MHLILDDGQITFLRQWESLSLAKWIGVDRRFQVLEQEVRETCGQISAGSEIHAEQPKMQEQAPALQN